MSNENKLREELKAQAAEAIDALSLEELKSISGGAYSSEKGYYCDICGKAFGSGWLGEAALAAHKKMHQINDGLNPTDNS